MSRALELARGQLGKTAPNPAVGCVLVSAGEIIAEGATGDGGRPHAEELAVMLAGNQARGAAAYVSLEPCSQRTSGKLSCAELLVNSGVARVVIGCAEPNPDARDGSKLLAGAGVAVETGVLREECEWLNRGFFKRLSKGRPWLAISTGPETFDGEFDLQRNEQFEAALDRLGAAGLTRVWVGHGTPLAAQLAARGLVDETIEPGGDK